MSWSRTVLWTTSGLLILLALFLWVSFRFGVISYMLLESIPPLKGEMKLFGYWTNLDRAYTTNSLYRFITGEGIRKSIYETIWKCKVPLRIKVFCGNCIIWKSRQILCLRKGAGKGVTSAPCVRVMNRWIISSSTVSCPSLFGAALNKCLVGAIFPVRWRIFFGNWVDSL